jgi:hypothetical protein
MMLPTCVYIVLRDGAPIAQAEVRVSKGYLEFWGVASIWFGFSSVPRSEPAGLFLCLPRSVDGTLEVTPTNSEPIESI